MGTSVFYVLVEIFVRIHIFVLAAIYSIKELYFEASNQGIDNILIADIHKSFMIQHAQKTAILTGADGTIGLYITRRLLALGFNVKAIVKKRANTPIELLKKEYLSADSRLVLYEVDLENPLSVSRFLRCISSFGSINLVILAAGIMLAEEKYIEKIESHIYVNVVSQAVLLDALRDNLTPKARIIGLSSTCLRATLFPGLLSKESFLYTYVGPYHAYAMSKLVLSIYLQQLSQQTGIQCVTLHPGVVPGRLYRNVNFFLKLMTYYILPFILRTPTFSSLLVLHTALRNDLQPGGYYEDCQVKDILNRYGNKEKKDIFNALTVIIKQLKLC